MTPSRINQSDNDMEFELDYFERSEGADGYDRQPFHDFWDRPLEYMVRLVKPKKVLEIGCAMGFFIESLRKRGIEAYGVDISRYAISKAAPEIRPYLYRCDVSENELPFPDNSLDFLYTLETIEHLKHPEYAIKAMERVLKPGGFVFMTTPAPGTSAAMADRTHINVRPFKKWKQCFSKAGLRVRQFFPWHWQPEKGRIGKIPEPFRTALRVILWYPREMIKPFQHIYLLGQKAK